VLRCVSRERPLDSVRSGVQELEEYNTIESTPSLSLAKLKNAAPWAGALAVSRSCRSRANSRSAAATIAGWRVSTPRPLWSEKAAQPRGLWRDRRNRAREHRGSYRKFTEDDQEGVQHCTGSSVSCTVGGQCHWATLPRKVSF
jgi:hypothetical protein